MSGDTYVLRAEAIAAPPAGIGFFEKWLSVWVALCIGAGLLLGNLFPGLFESLANLEIASVNLVVAVLIWAMIYPMMLAVDFSSLSHIGDRPEGAGADGRSELADQAVHSGGARSPVLEGPVRRPDPPGRRAAIHRQPDPARRRALHGNGVRLVASDARRSTYTLVQVSVNVIMIFAFAPIVALLLGVTDIAVPWETLLLSVRLYILIPLGAGGATRQRLARGRLGENAKAAVARFTAAVKPFSVIGLLATVVLHFRLPR